MPSSQVALLVKNLPANAEDIRDLGSIPGSRRSPGEGNGNPLQYSCLENPMDRGVQSATIHGVSKSWTRLKQLSMHACSAFHFSCGLPRCHFLVQNSFVPILFLYLLFSNTFLCYRLKNTICIFKEKIYFISEYSWFTVLHWFQMYSQVIQLYTHIYRFFSDSFLIQAITRY